MSYNNQDINNIKNDIKSIKLMFLGLLITTPIYYTSIYLLSKQVCKQAFLTINEYINIVEKNNEKKNILEDESERELTNSGCSYSSSDGHELDASEYNNIPLCKKGIFNFY